MQPAALFSVKGGATNYQYLPGDPHWGQHTDALKSNVYMHGAEYEQTVDNSAFLNYSYNIRVNVIGNIVVLGRQTQNIVIL